jgi:hypothetical protein
MVRRHNGSIIGVTTPITKTTPSNGVFGLFEASVELNDLLWPGSGAAGWYYQGNNNGYTMVGTPTNAPLTVPTGYPSGNVFDKWSLASNVTATVIGASNVPYREGAGATSISSGYTYKVGGNNPFANPLESVSHASDAIVDIGYGGVGSPSPVAQQGNTGTISSETKFYVFGGSYSNNTPSNRFSETPFASTVPTSPGTNPNLPVQGTIIPAVFFSSPTVPEPLSGGESVSHAGTELAGYYYNAVTVPNVAGAYVQKFTYSSESTSLMNGGVLPYVWGSHTKGFADRNYCYFAGGQANVAPAPVQPAFDGASEYSATMNYIAKFPLASEDVFTNVGDLTVGRSRHASINGLTDGYIAGGYTPAATNVIDKISFASDGDAVDHGDLAHARSYLQGGQS